jgi:DMSO/TMAO reductase YedYZ molybdopterin-dependent catalytic subunit
VTPAARFYRIDTATFVPVIDVDTWRLRVTGMVDHPASYSYEELSARDLVDEPVTLACVSNDVGGHLIGNGRWRGVPLDALLGPAGVHPEATQLVGRAVDGFTVGVPTAVALDGRVAMVVVGLDGDVLADVHGFPARLVVAGLYGYASATKWLTELELTRLEDLDPFWVARGWDRDGSILTQARIDVPASGARVPAGTLVAAGVAWAPPTGVAAVEVQLDRGPWQPARLAAVASTNTWVQWTCTFADVAPGQHLLAARATDQLGQVQTAATRPAEPSGATGYPYRGFSVA